MLELRTYEIKPQSRNQGQKCIPQTLFVVLPNYFKTLEKCCRIRRLLNSDVANSILPHILLRLRLFMLVLGDRYHAELF